MDDLRVKGYNGQLEFDGEAVTLSRRGLLARVSSGGGERRIPVSAIRAVQYVAPNVVSNGFIRLVLEGDAAAVPSVRKVADDEDAVLVTFQHRKEAGPFVEAVGAAVDAAAESGAPAGEVEWTVEKRHRSLSEAVDHAQARVDGWADRLPVASVGGADGALTLYTDRVEHAGQFGTGRESTPLSVDVVARVESGSELESRVTMTRLVALGIFAFAAKKKRGGEVFVTVESPDVFWMVEVPRKSVGQARKFVAALEQAKRSLPPSA